MTKSNADLLYTAIKEGNKQEVLNLLAKDVHPDINIKSDDYGDYKPLYIAVESNQIEIVKILLDSGKVNVNYQNGRNVQTALERAVQELEIDMIELLVNVKDIDINTKPHLENCSLFLSLVKHRCKTHGIDRINPNSAIVKSPYEMKLTKVIELFLSNPNLDINTQESWIGNSALHYAAKEYHMEIVQLLLNYNRINPNTLNRYGDSALHCAVKKGNIEIVQLLLDDNRMNPNILNGDGASALHIAVQKRFMITLESLIKSDKVNVNITDSDGFNILHRVVEKGDLEMTKVLLTYEKINVNALTKTGKTLIDIAVDYGDTNIVKLIIDKVDLNKQDSDGNTALHKAILSGNVDILKLVLNKDKLDLSIKNNDKLTPVELSQTQKDKEITEILKEYGGNLDDNEKSNTVSYSPNEENEISPVSLVGENNDDNVDLF